MLNLSKLSHLEQVAIIKTATPEAVRSVWNSLASGMRKANGAGPGRPRKVIQSGSGDANGSGSDTRNEECK